MRYVRQNAGADKIAGRPCGNPVCSFHEADAAALLLLPFNIARLGWVEKQALIVFFFNKDCLKCLVVLVLLLQVDTARLAKR